MTLALVRLDDRLIHGQVVIGWVNALGATRIVVVDDRVAANTWEQDIYRLGVPAGLTVEFHAVAAAAKGIDDWAARSERFIVLVADVGSAARLCELTDTVSVLNLGGIHDGSGRVQRLPYIYLSEDEASRLKSVAEAGVRVEAQAVPTERPIPLDEVLG